MTPLERSLLQAVLAQPERYDRRLVYAQWLRERCDPRGEYIQLVCELELGDLTDSRHDYCEERVAELLRRYRRRWVGEIARYVEACEFRGGFVEFVEMSGYQFMDHLTQLCALAPIRWVSLRSPLPVRSVSCHRMLRRLRGISLDGNRLNDLQVQQLARSRYTGQLTRLSLSGCGLDDACLGELAGSRNLNRLEMLDLSRNQFGARGVGKLCAWPGLARVKRLDLSFNRIRPSGMKALVDSRYLTQVVELDLTASGPLDARSQALLQSRFGDRARW